MKGIWLVALLALAARADGARAARPLNQPVLVELFTSQGCSSCPPAERFVRELPALGLGADKVVALDFHVDIWDHLGWPDPFATPAFTERQAWYARSAGLRAADGRHALSGIYTPQMIVAGQVHFPGGERDVALRQIAAAGARPAVATLALRADVDGDVATVHVRVGGDRLDRSGDWRLTVALLQKTAETRVGRGENEGETLREASIVRGLSDRVPLGPSNLELAVKLRKPADLGWRNAALVAFVQSEKTREVAGVAEIEVPARSRGVAARAASPLAQRPSDQPCPPSAGQVKSAVPPQPTGSTNVAGPPTQAVPPSPPW